MGTVALIILIAAMFAFFRHLSDGKDIEEKNAEFAISAATDIINSVSIKEANDEVKVEVVERFRQWIPQMLEKKLETLLESTYADFIKLAQSNMNIDNERIVWILSRAVDSGPIESWQKHLNTLVYGDEKIGFPDTNTNNGRFLSGRTYVINVEDGIVKWEQFGKDDEKYIKYYRATFDESVGAANERHKYLNSSRIYSSIFPADDGGIYLSFVAVDDALDPSHILSQAYIGVNSYKYAVKACSQGSLIDEEKNDLTPFSIKTQPKDWESFIQEGMIEVLYDSNKIIIKEENDMVAALRYMTKQSDKAIDYWT